MNNTRLKCQAAKIRALTKKQGIAVSVTVCNKSYIYIQPNRDARHRFNAIEQTWLIKIGLQFGFVGIDGKPYNDTGYHFGGFAFH